MLNKLVCLVIFIIMAVSLAGCRQEPPVTTIPSDTTPPATTSAPVPTTSLPATTTAPVTTTITPPTSDTKWNYSRPITEALSVTAGSSDASIGQLGTHQVSVSIPAEAFDKDTGVILATPETVPEVDLSKITPLGAPVEIKAGDSPVRMDRPVTIRFAIDPGEITADTETGEFRILYFNGAYWQHSLPDEVNLDQRYLEFTTYHFSLFGYGKVDVEQRITDYTSNKALAGYAQKVADKHIEQAIEQVVKHVLKEQLGLDDKGMESQVLSSILLDGEYASMLQNVRNGDVESFNQNLQILVGKKIVDNVPRSMLSAALGGIIGGAGTIAAAAEAAGYLAEGQYYNAARILGENLADKFMITTVGKIAVATVQNEIDAWKSREIEAAYQAYKKGSDGTWWFGGYSNDPGDFDAVWDQMRGAARQLWIEAIREQNEARWLAGYEPLSSDEEDRIREQVRLNLKRQFTQRLEDEIQVEKERAQLADLISLYDENGFLLKGGLWWTQDYELETWLDVLMNLKDKIMRDTRTNELMSEGFHENRIGLNHIMRLTIIWYNEGEEAYKEYLINELGIEFKPVVNIPPVMYVAEWFSPNPPFPQRFHSDGRIFWDADNVRLYEGAYTTHVNYFHRLVFWNIGGLGGEEYWEAIMYDGYRAFGPTRVVTFAEERIYSDNHPQAGQTYIHSLSEPSDYLPPDAVWHYATLQFSGGPDGVFSGFRESARTGEESRTHLLEGHIIFEEGQYRIVFSTGMSITMDFIASNVFADWK